MDQKQDYRQMVEEFVAMAGMRCTLVGMGVWLSPVIYAIVVALIANFADIPPKAEVDRQAVEFTRIMAVVLLVVAFALAPVAFMILRLFTRVEAQNIAVDADPGARMRVLFNIYFRASLLAGAIAEVPAIFALLLSLFIMFTVGAGFMAMPLVAVCAGVMWLEALLLAAMVVPSAGRLERFLLAVEEEKGYARD